jgi:hypothetical protein
MVNDMDDINESVLMRETSLFLHLSMESVTQRRCDL